MSGKINQTELITHTFEPIYDESSRVLMLGTMPSPKSREVGFYYGHPRNRFWKVIADVCCEAEPITIEEKKGLAIRNHIAVWDVLESCEIRGADDSSIKSPKANDMSKILNAANIKAIYATGKKAAELYNRYCLPVTGMDIITLPSTSPANCRVTYAQLYEAYKDILKHCQ